jgi:heme/copper-type cytochrome/quinol oxidase subunit 2
MRSPLRRVAAGLAVLIATVLVAIALAPVESLAQGCAMCATYLSNGADPRANAFKVSIMFLMCMPFVVVGSAGGWILWMHWRSRSQRPELQVLRAEGEGAS